MIIYLAGKMEGLPDYGRSTFKDMEEKLTAAGYTVLNPALLPTTLRPASYLPICLAMVDAANAVYLIDEWESSKGAELEYQYAKYQGKLLLYGDPKHLEYILNPI